MRNILLILIALLSFAVWPARQIYAQSGCVGDPCVFETPTPGPTPTATTPAGTGTPTAVPLPTAVEFPNPQYPVPTSIPTVSFPTLPSPIAVTLPAPTPISNLTPSPFPLPSPITSSLLITAPSPITLSTLNLPVTGSTTVELSEISTTIVVSYTQIQTFSGQLTGTQAFTTASQVISGTTEFTNDLISYTNSITQSYTELQGTEVITVLSAPIDYVPELPRPLADVGWTFEQLGGDESFTLRSWSGFAGYIASLPVQLVKSIFRLADYLGPFGLFLIWLLIMFVLVIAVEGMKLLYHIIITVVDVIMKLVDLIGQYLPTGG